MKRIKLILCLILLFSGLLSSAQAEDPSNLDPWKDWVRNRHPEWNCAVVDGVRECSWPGSCKLNLSEKAGKFSVEGELLSKGFLPLPGSSEFPPAKIVVSSLTTNSVVVPHSIEIVDGKYFVKLPAGSYKIEGELSWSAIPPEIPIPDEIGSVRLETDSDQNINRGNNIIWFEKVDENKDLDRVSVVVSRNIRDDSPLYIETLITLGISGNARSINLGQVIPAHSILIGITSALPHQITKEGVLTIQGLSGSHQIKVYSIIPQPVSEVTLTSLSQTYWPAEETWVWSPNNNLRTVEIDGGLSLSADSDLIPQEWKGQGAPYQIDITKGISIKQMTRGDTQVKTNNVQLARELWLDLDGEGYTIKDTFTGELKNGVRLNAKPELKLGRADIDSRPTLLSVDPVTNAHGIEIRTDNINVSAVSRIEGQEEFAAVGWELPVSNLSLNLYLPPSWKLFHSVGFQGEANSWLGSWTLLEVFLSVLLVIGTLKVMGTLISLLVASSLILNHNEYLEPRMLLFHILVAGVLAKLVDNKESGFYKFSHTYLVSTVVLWCAEALTLMKLQITQILYPQLESGTRYRTFLQEIFYWIELSPYSWLLLVLVVFLFFQQLKRFQQAQGFIKKFVSLIILVCILIFAFALRGMFTVTTFSAGRMAGGVVSPVPQSAYKAKSPYQRYDSFNALRKEGADSGTYEMLQEQKNEPQNDVKLKSVQTGPALPLWRWKGFGFNFMGPVSPDQKLKVYLISPFVNRILAVLRLLIISLLMILLIKKSVPQKIIDKILTYKTMKKAATTGAFLIITLFTSSYNAYAEFPSSELLNELENRLKEKECQRPSCSNIEKLFINIHDNKIFLTADVISEGLSAVYLPGPLSEFVLSDVAINGKSTNGYRSSSDGYLAVKVPDGRSKISVFAVIDHKDVTLQFKQSPVHTSFSADGWLAEGISPSGTVAATVRIVPIDKENIFQENEQKTDLGIWFNLDRKIELGEKNKIHTTITKLGDNNKTFNINLKLLPEEQVIEGPIADRKGNDAVVRFPENSRSITLESTLPEVSKISLHEEKTEFLSQTWQVFCSLALNCTYTGATPSDSPSGNNKSWFWQPFPGDSVEINMKPLAAVKGESLTVDSLTHLVTWGMSRKQGEIQFTLRNTDQSSFSVDLPKDVHISSSTLDGRSGGVITSDGKSTFLLQPGEHSGVVSYEQNWNPDRVEYVTAVKLSEPVHNLNIHVKPSPDRWILWVGGLSWGPAVLIWAKLILIAILLVALSHFSFIDLGILNSAVLAVGLVSLPSLYMGIPVIWFMVMKYLTLDQRDVNILSAHKWKVIFIILTILSFLQFYSIVESGLVIQPPMLIVGNQSSNYLLKWYIDHSTADVAQPWIVSLPISYWRFIMLLWSTWLAVNLIKWTKESVQVFRGL